jgi:hypothetical protein
VCEIDEDIAASEEMSKSNFHFEAVTAHLRNCQKEIRDRLIDRSMPTIIAHTLCSLMRASIDPSRRMSEAKAIPLRH